MVFKKFQKILSAFSIIAILWGQLLFPTIIFAQEATPSATEVEPSAEPSPSPTPEPSPIPVVDDNLTSASASDSAGLNVNPEEVESSAEVTPSPWQVTDGIATTSNPVVLNQTYIAPQNDKVTVTFTKLPESSGTLTIKQIILSQEDKEDLGAVTDTAYDITSTMENGTFEYTLTLPTPQTQNVEVKASEDGENFVTLGGVTAQQDTVTITGLTHFTIFVVVGTIDFANDEVTNDFDESFSDVLINEFVFNTSAFGDVGEWVELYNRTDGAINLSGWELCELTGSGNENCTSLSNSSIPAFGFVVEEFSSARLNDSGDTINLRNDADTLISQVSYDSAADNVVGAFDVGNMAADQSVGRIRDGDGTWDFFPTPTKGSSNHATLYVDVNGSDNEYGTFNNPFTLIQDGIDAVSEGGTVNVAFGEYYENLTIDKSLSLLGDQGDESAGPGGDAPEIIADVCEQSNSVLNIGANNITVSGFILNGDNCGYPVVRIDDVSGVIIEDNEIINGYRGINLRYGASNNTITNNLIHNNSDGISVSSSTNNIISGNEIYNNDNYGIFLRQGEGDGDVSGNEILSNNIHDNSTGIYGESNLSFSDLIISDNQITDNWDYGIFFDGVSNSSLTIGGEDGGNTITGNSTGIYLSGFCCGGGEINNSTVTIDGNTISSNSSDGIYVDIITNFLYLMS